MVHRQVFTRANHYDEAMVFKKKNKANVDCPD